MKAQPAKTTRSDSLFERAIQRRAIEAVIWGMPAVNFELMYQSSVKARGGYNRVVYWSRLPNWKNQTLTPNPDTIYFMPFINTRDDGPMVMEIPAAGDGSITGSIDDCWQTALEDVGPAGADKGKGGKYLILPPGHKDRIPSGYIPLPAASFQSFALLRSNLASGSDADVAKAVAYGKRVKVYPMARAANPPKTVFVDAVDDIYNGTIPYDLRFFQALKRMMQYEPWLERDKAMIDILKSIGIEKGKPFDPDTKTAKILNDAAADAHAYLKSRYESVFQPPFDSTARWALPASKELIASVESNFALPDAYPTEARGLAYSYAYFSPKHMGEGQFYLMTIKDKAGNDLDGANAYRLRVPPKPPVRLYWSATVYDRATHALIRGSQWSSRSSNTPGLQKNPDGSMDVYFAPKAPSGREPNWVPTKADGQFEVLFRLYGPEKEFFDKKWILPDIEKVAIK